LLWQRPSSDRKRKEQRWMLSVINWRVSVNQHTKYESYEMQPQNLQCLTRPWYRLF